MALRDHRGIPLEVGDQVVVPKSLIDGDTVLAKILDIRELQAANQPPMKQVKFEITVTIGIPLQATRLPDIFKLPALEPENKLVV